MRIGILVKETSWIYRIFKSWRHEKKMKILIKIHQTTMRKFTW